MWPLLVLLTESHLQVITWASSRNSVQCILHSLMRPSGSCFTTAVLNAGPSWQGPLHLVFIGLLLMLISSGCRVGLFGQMMPLNPGGFFKPCTWFYEDTRWVRALSCFCTRERNAGGSCNIGIEVGMSSDISVAVLRDVSCYQQCVAW